MQAVRISTYTRSASSGPRKPDRNDRESERGKRNRESERRNYRGRAALSGPRL